MKRPAHHNNSNACTPPTRVRYPPPDPMTTRPQSSSTAVCPHRRGGLFLAASTALLVLSSSSQILAFSPSHAAQGNCRHLPARSRSSSRLPSSLSYAQEADDSNARPSTAAAAAAASAATAYPPPAPGRTTGGSDDKDDNGADLQQSISSARAIMEARTDEINTLRSSQAEQLTKISELTANLAKSHAASSSIG